MYGKNRFCERLHKTFSNNIIFACSICRIDFKLCSFKNPCSPITFKFNAENRKNSQIITM